MRLTSRQLARLKVETKSGASLGHVAECVVETEGQMIAQYRVRASLLKHREYLVSRDQVVAIDDKRMVVEDAVKAQGIVASRADNKFATGIEPATMRK